MGPHGRAFIWVLAGRARFIFPPPFFFSHLFLSPRSRLSAHQSAGSVVRTAHDARRGLGDVLAALRTTPGSRQPSVEEQFEADLDLLFSSFSFWGSVVGELLKTLFWSFFRWKSDLFVAAVDLDDFFSSGQRDWEEWERCKQTVDRTDST